MLLGAPLTMGTVIMKNLVPVVLGNFIAGAVVVAGSYSYQFGAIGCKSRERFRAHLKAYELRKQSERDAKKVKAANGEKKKELAGAYE